MSTQDQPASSSNVTGTYGSEGLSRGIDEEQARHSLSQDSSLKPQGFRAGVGLENVARRTLGIILLLTTVVLWTTSNFLASVSYSRDFQSFRRLTFNSIYSQTTPTRSHTSLPTSIQHYLPFLWSRFFSELLPSMDSAK